MNGEGGGEGGGGNVLQLPRSQYARIVRAAARPPRGPAPAITVTRAAAARTNTISGRKRERAFKTVRPSSIIIFLYAL